MKSNSYFGQNSSFGPGERIRRKKNPTFFPPLMCGERIKVKSPLCSGTGMAGWGKGDPEKVGDPQVGEGNRVQHQHRARCFQHTARRQDRARAGDAGAYLQREVVGQLRQQQRELLQIDATAVHDALLGAAAVAGAAVGRAWWAPSPHNTLGEVVGGGTAQRQQPQHQQLPAPGWHRPWNRERGQPEAGAAQQPGLLQPSAQRPP